ncbi:DUF2971 domain-containing protein [Bacillus cereus group sp. N28]|uniref:DUF2971 domain-containing protein n=1 Tax=Bacillus TaxID=1386 RepID=UPI000CFB0317|nr:MULTISPECIES: DUF2971 domain-containing protein [Bacillus]MBJ7961454.1 DUF2971 domain-containing protein [Bacillus cereus group sp. N28]PRD03999.1 hypothetical protein CQ058_30755 [Bacillus sp. MYb56]
MYRFRNIKSLLGEYEELENQEIYFSELDSLNDPMEGIREYYWQGDIIVWKNFFKHYMYSLTHVFLMSKLLSELNNSQIPIWDREKYYSEKYEKIINMVYEHVFNSKYINFCLNFLSKESKETSQEEIYVYLKILHYFTLEAIFEVHMELGLSSQSINPFTSIIKSDLITDLKEIMEKFDKNPNRYNDYIQVYKEALNDSELADADRVEKNQNSQKAKFIYVEFTERYLKKITELTYPKCYVACFMDNCTNSAVWGHYGDSHKGVCLKFRTHDVDVPKIELETIIGYSDLKKIYNYRPFEFNKMNYSNQIQRINFFSHLGYLKHNVLLKQWYTDSEGNISNCANHLNDDVVEYWQKEYWHSYQVPFLNKSIDWQYEKEYRLLLFSVLDSYTEVQDRKLKYKFEDLEAIIFGMKTSREDRIKIINIIKEKSKQENRENFDFYEAISSKGEITIKKLRIQPWFEVPPFQ